MNSNNTIFHQKLHYIKHYGETTFDSKDIWAIKKKKKSTIQTIHFLSNQTFSYNTIKKYLTAHIFIRKCKSFLIISVILRIQAVVLSFLQQFQDVCYLQLFQTLKHDKNLLSFIPVSFSTEEEIKFVSIW